MDLKKLIKTGAIFKWRIQLGYAAIGIFGMGLVIAKTVQDVIKPFIEIPMYILFPLGVIGLWVAGFLYDKMGLYSNEMEYSSSRNTYYEKYLRGKFPKDEEVK